MLHRIALTQVLPAAASQEDAQQTITELAQTLSQEDVQLYYQIALIGRRDLQLAPDLRSGFEMLMLRMLAFRPVDYESKPIKTPKQMPVSKPVSVDPIVQKTIEKPTDSASAPDWAAMIKAMKIGGMTRELANNCIIGAIDDQALTLFLERSHKQLLGDTTEQKLHKAIQAHFGKPMKLIIDVKDIDQDTPAVQIDLERQDRQAQAEQVINEDNNIRALKEKFGARVIPGTIEPLIKV